MYSNVYDDVTDFHACRFTKNTKNLSILQLKYYFLLEKKSHSLQIKVF